MATIMMPTDRPSFDSIEDEFDAVHNMLHNESFADDQSTVAATKDQWDALKDKRFPTNDQLTIVTIEYGGMDYLSDEAVYARVLNDILAKRTIKISNDYFGGDPLVGKVKTAFICYYWEGYVPVDVKGTEGTTVELLKGRTFEENPSRCK